MNRLIQFLTLIFTLTSLSIFAQDPNFHIYLCFGQSNMEGQGTIEAQDQSVDSRFRIMQAVNCTGQPQETWRTATPPLARCNTGLGPADYFGREMVANLPSNIKVGIVHVSVAGCKIELFDKNNYQSYVNSLGANEQYMVNIINAYGGNPYARLVELAQLAQQDGVIKGILLHQGESNTGDQQWPNKVKGVYDNLLNDLGLNANDVPLLAGQVVDAAQGGICASHNAIINSLPNTIPTAHVISSSGCTDQADNLHFNSAGYRLLGERYADMMLSLLGVTEENDDNIVVRANGTDGTEILELIVDGQVLTTWNLSAGFNTYTYNGPSTGVFRINYTNDADGRDVQLDYLEVDGVRYEAEDQQINTGSYANSACGGGEYTEYMYCSGYVEFNLIDPTQDTDNDGTPDVDDDCPNDPNKIVPGECGCGTAEGDCEPSEYPIIKWKIPGGNQGLAACKGKFLGNIMPSSWAGPVIRSDFGTYWNQVTAENAGKWEVVEGTRDNYSWGDLDQMYNYCQQNGLPFKHHVFVWGSQQPSWIGSLSQQEQREEVEEWYSLFAQRYPDTDIIDVVNESIRNHAPEVTFKDALGGLNNGASNPYLSQHPEYGPYGTGWDYIIYSFAKAREYFPNAILLLNDYGIINDPTAIVEHLEIVNILKDRGLIDGVGIQCHQFNVDNMTGAQVTNNLNQLATAGLPIHVTELDITGGSEQQQRDRYADLFPAFWEHEAVAGVTLWGYVEGTTWIDNTGILNSNGSERMAMTWLKQYMASQPDVCNQGNITVEITSPSDGENIEVNTSVTITATATDEDGTISSVAFYADGNLISTDNSSPYSVTWTPTVTGDYELTAVATDNESNEGTSAVVDVTVSVPQGPYNGTVHPIPGTIQLEEYDVGGNGSAYYDDTPGSEVTPVVNFRTTEDVDIENCTDTGGGYNIGWATDGEWLEYTVNVTAAGTYDLEIRYAIGETGSKEIHFEMDGTNLAGAITLPNTGGWQTWETFTVTDLDLTAGQKIMRLSIDADYVNLNYVTFTAQAEVDTDEDGTPDISDACPNDPNKAASVGACGCGTPDTDSDADGIADCNDTYPNDADNDGITTTDDCDDNNAEIGPAITWYEDTDGDGVGVNNSTQTNCAQPTGYVATAGDECPNDINKTTPGNCGCGNTEESCLDCAGTPNGTAFIDDCDNCVASQQEACIQDCNGDFGGTAVIDACNECTGGNTGLPVVTDPTKCLATGIEDYNANNLNIYPNPTTGELHLPAATMWHLFNAQGEIIQEGDAAYLNLSNQPDGIYFLKIEGNVIKVVKE